MASVTSVAVLELNKPRRRASRGCTRRFGGTSWGEAWWTIGISGMNLTFRDKVFHWFLAEENAGGEIPRVTGDVLKACRPYPVLEYFRHGEEMDPAFHGLVFMGVPNSLGGLFGRFQLLYSLWEEHNMLISSRRFPKLLWGETMP